MPDLSRSLLDFMGRDELAANLFRLTLTEGRIQRDQVKGQAALEDVAEKVGKRVRAALIEETGKRPEDLAISTDIKKVRSGLRSTAKGFGQFIDNLNEQRAYEAKALEGVTENPQDCPECLTGDSANHFGSKQCTVGSLASGGSVAHCQCDYCRPFRPKPQ